MPTPFETLALLGAADPIYLLEVDYYSPSAYGGSGIATFNDRPFSALPDGEEVVVSEDTLRFASADFVTATTDTPARTAYSGRQIQPPTVQRALPLTPGATTRTGFARGEIVLEDAARELDTFIAQSGIDGRSVRVLAGLASWPLADFGVVFSGSGLRWWRDGDNVRLSVRDNSFKLEAALQRETYAGTGGADGDSALANLPKPVAFGAVYNATPVLINASALIYQVSWRQIEAIDEVYDGALPFTATGSDYATYALLAAATIASGHYATCLALGLFRLGSAAANAVTVDLQGDAEGSYVTTAAAIIERMIVDLGRRESSEVDSAAMAAFAAAEPGVIGWYRGPEPISAAEALDQVCAGVFAWWGCSRAGLFLADQLEPPDAGDVADFSLDVGDIQDIRLAAPPEAAFPPPWRVGIGYRRCWTVQPGDGLTAAATQARRQFVGAQYRYALAVDGTILGPYRMAQDWQYLPALYDEQADAEAQASDQLDRYRGGMRLFDVSVKALRGFVLDLGAGGAITFPGESLSSTPSRIVSINEDPANDTTMLQVWVNNG